MEQFNQKAEKLRHSEKNYTMKNKVEKLPKLLTGKKVDKVRYFLKLYPG